MKKEELYESYINAERYTLNGKAIRPDKSMTPERLEEIKQDAVLDMEHNNNTSRLCAFHGGKCEKTCLAFVPSNVIQNSGICQATKPRCKRMYK